MCENIYNIISNDCSSGFFYKNNNLPYATVFPWIRIKDEMYIDMLKNYDNIDFSKIQVKYYWELSQDDIDNKVCKYSNGYNIHNQMMYGIVDSYIVSFSHYFFDPTYFNCVKTDGVDKRSAKIREYIENSLVNRYKRMKSANKKAYIYHIKNDHEINRSTIISFINIDKNVPKIIFDNNYKFTWVKCLATKYNILYINDINFDEKDSAIKIKEYIDHYKLS